MRAQKLCFIGMIFIVTMLMWGNVFQGTAISKPIDDEKQKVVYQINEPNVSVVKYALGLIEKHIKAVGGPVGIDIKVVFHGPALQLFQGEYTDPQLVEKLERVIKRGVHPEVCQVTMKRVHKTMEMFVAGMVSTPTAFGVERVVDLQMQGYRFINWSYPHEIVMRPDVL